jgi:hypothetical protein
VNTRAGSYLLYFVAYSGVIDEILEGPGEHLPENGDDWPVL